MKNFKLVSIVLIAVLSFSFQSCEDDQTLQDQTQELKSISRILEVETALNDIMLPVGTKISALSDSEMEIELPGDFKFLLFDAKEGISYSKFGGYSCTCSSSGSCTSFYNDRVGYGCLQSTCSGSCTGKPTGGDKYKLAYGIVNTTSKELLGEKFVASGNLTRKGMELFLNNVAKDKILEFTDIAFSTSDFKNSSELLEVKGEEFATNIVLQYLGISFSTIVPEFDNNSQFIKFQKGPTVSCAGSNGCSCEQDKTCFLGQCVYTCNGCTTCTISADKK